MSGVGGYKYHVIQFLDVPYKGIADFVCVPSSWVQSCGPGVPVVKVSYPVEKPALTEERVMKRIKKSNNWKSFLSIMRYSTDNYENAKFYIQQEINNSKKKKGDSYVDAVNIQDRTKKSGKKNGDRTLLSAKADQKTGISTQTAVSKATIDNNAFVVGMIDDLGWCVSSKSANTITLKRKALPVPDKENRNKRFRVNEPDEYVSQVAGPSSKTPVNQNPSKTTHSLDPKIISQLVTSPMFGKWCILMKELQKCFENSIFKELINKLLNKDNDGSAPQNNDPIASASSDKTVAAPKLNKEKINEKPLEDKDTDNHENQPLDNNNSSKEVYINLDEDEELSPGNVELMNKDNDGSAPQNNDPIASASSDKTVAAPKLNKEKINEKPLEDKDTDNHENQPLDNDDSSKEVYINLDEDEELSPGNVELINKDNDGSAPQNKNSIASASSDEAPKCNEEKKNEQPLEEKDTDNDDDKDTDKDTDKDQPLDNDHNSEDGYFDLNEYDELPPEYDANDSRWTLKYHGPAPGNIELIPNTGVYVTNYKIFPKSPISLAFTLLRGIFTKNALNICWLPDPGAKAIARHGTKVRPALDEYALSVLMHFVTDHANEDFDPDYILESMRQKIRGCPVDEMDYRWRP